MTGEERPLAVDLCTGLGGWAAGLVDAGFYVIGVDLEDMFAALGEPKPDHFSLMRQDIRTVRGSQFKRADLIVSSSPCQNFSYSAMPFTRARNQHGPFLGIKLFHEQFRIQREASEAKGEHIPMICENVRGAENWVGKARYNFGSFYLYGDVPTTLMPKPERAIKVPGFRFDGSGASFQTASVKEGLKHGGDWFSDPSSPSRQGGQVKAAEGRKGAGAGAGAEWFDQNHCVKSSNSPARKAASARIAKIPYRLSSAIGRIFFESITTGIPVAMPLTQTELF